mmetsp:Transcript_8681/g.39464  ORF Transcript_8681/g.39464 Transcript_8681/m.39464 type:complete len:286 (+) Transcript_8681:281-1138(+)
MAEDTPPPSPVSISWSPPPTVTSTPALEAAAAAILQRHFKLYGPSFFHWTFISRSTRNISAITSAGAIVVVLPSIHRCSATSLCCIRCACTWLGRRGPTALPLPPAPCSAASAPCCSSPASNSAPRYPPNRLRLLSNSRKYATVALLRSWCRSASTTCSRSNPRFTTISNVSASTLVACARVSGGGTTRYRGRCTTYHGCVRISDIVIRFSGSTRSIRAIKSLAPGLRCDGKLYIPPLIFLNKLGMDSSSNGSEPHRSAYRITPHDHTSTSGPLYSFPEMTSGAA